jgi:hypothetical protein
MATLAPPQPKVYLPDDSRFGSTFAYVSFEGRAQEQSGSTLAEPLKRARQYLQKWSHVIPFQDREDIRLRGVQRIEHSRRTLFTTQMAIRTKDLPKWKPQITILRRVLEEDNA